MPKSSEFGDTLADRDGARLEMHFGGRDPTRLDEYLEPIHGCCARCLDSIHQFVDSQMWECGRVTLPLSYHGKLANGSQSC